MLKLILNIGMSFLKQRVNVLIFIVIQIQPFVLLYLNVGEFMLNIIVVVEPSVNDGEHTIDAIVFFDVGSFENINSAEVEVTLILGRVFNAIVDVDNMTAGVIRSPHDAENQKIEIISNIIIFNYSFISNMCYK